jgi:hypothetical protein
MWRCRWSAKYFGTSAHASGGDLQRCEVRRQRCRIRFGAPSSCQHSYLEGQPIRGGKDWNVTPGFPCCDSKVWQPVEVKRKNDEGLTGLLSRFLLVRWQKISLWLRLGGRPLSSATGSHLPRRSSSVKERSTSTKRGKSTFPAENGIP